MVIVTKLSDDSERIRRITLRINEALFSAYPLIPEDQKIISECSQLLLTLLKENKQPLRVEAIIKWTKLFLESNNQKMRGEIRTLITYIVEKLCDPSATKSLFLLLKGSVFIGEFFDLFI